MARETSRETIIEAVNSPVNAWRVGAGAQGTERPGLLRSLPPWQRSICVSGDVQEFVGQSMRRRAFQNGAGKFGGTGLRKGHRDVNKLRNEACPGRRAVTGVGPHDHEGP